MTTFAINDMIASRYRVQGQLGIGGQAIVYDVIDQHQQRRLALKVLRLDQDAESKAVTMARFKREAQLLEQLKSPYIIRMHDFGALDNGALFMASEFVDGHSLEDTLKLETTLPPKRAQNILEQTLHALGEAHNLGVLHRDIKPDNLMLFQDEHNNESVKVLDFGIAKLTQDTQQLTDINSVVGTPKYIAPEMFEKQPLTPAYDLYALGLVTLKMLTGAHPLDGVGMRKVLMSFVDPNSYELPTTLHVPEGLRRVVNRMLQKDLTMRYTSTAEIFKTLKRWQTAETQAVSFTPKKTAGAGIIRSRRTSKPRPQPLDSENETIAFDKRDVTKHDPS